MSSDSSEISSDSSEISSESSENNDIQKKGKKLYTNPKTGYWSKAKMVTKYKKMLDNMPSIQRHKEVKARDKRKLYRKIQANYPLQSIQVDLAFLPALKSPLNHNNVGFMVIIDVFSRYLWIKTFTNRKSLHVPLETIIQQIKRETNKYPDNITGDNEFATTQMHHLAAKYDFELWFGDAHEKFRTGIAERVIRTIKNLIKRYLTQNNTSKYIDILHDLIENYNNTIHRSINDTPANVLRTGKVGVVKKVEKHIPQLAERTRVRILQKRDALTKGDVPTYGKNVYEVHGRDRNRYVLRNKETKQPLQKRYGRHQLQPIKRVNNVKNNQNNAKNRPIPQNIPKNRPIPQNIPKNRPIPKNIPKKVSFSNNNEKKQQNIPKNRPIPKNIPKNRSVLPTLFENMGYDEQIAENRRINTHQRRLNSQGINLDNIIDQQEKKEAKIVAGIDRSSPRVKKVQQKLALRRSTRVRKKPDFYVPQDNRK